MADRKVVIEEIRSVFTANIADYQAKMQRLSQQVSNVTGNLESVKRTAASAMASPSASTQKLGRALDATANKLQQQRQHFEQLSRAGDQYAQEMEQLKTKLGGMQSVYQTIQQATAGIDLSTPLQKQMEAARAEVERLDMEADALREKIRHLETGGMGEKWIFTDSNELLSLDAARARLDQLSQSAAAADARFERLRAAMAAIGIENFGYASAAGLQQLKAEIEGAQIKLGTLGDRMSDTANRAETVAASMGRTRQVLDQQAGSLSKTSRLFAGLKTALGRIGSAAASGLGRVKDHILGIGSRARSSVGGVDGLWKAIKRVAAVGIALKLTRSLFGRLRTVVNNYLSTNQAAAATVERLRNGLSKALAPAINTIIGLLSRVMPYLVGIVDAVASLITNIFGTGWTNVSTGLGTAADNAGTAADNVSDLAGSTKKAAKAQKEYNKLLAGFDEITKLEEQDSDSGSGGGSGGRGGGATQSTAAGTAGIAGKLPAWLSDLAGQLRALYQAQDFTGIGALLATKFGELVDYLDGIIGGSAFRKRVYAVCDHVVDAINGFFERLTFSDGTRASIATRFGYLIGDSLTLVMNTLNRFLRKVKWEKIGQAVAQSINGMLKKLNANKVNFGTLFARLINAGIRGLAGFVNTINWSDIGTFLAKNINSFFSTVDWAEAGKTATNLIHGLFTSLITAIQEIDWMNVGKSIGEFLANIDWIQVLADVGTAIFGAFAGILSGLGAFLNEAFNGAFANADPHSLQLGLSLTVGDTKYPMTTSGVNSAASGAANVLQKAIDSAFSQVKNQTNLEITASVVVIDVVQSAIDAAKSVIRTAVTGVKGSVTEVSKPTDKKKGVPAVKTYIRNAVSEVKGSVTKVSKPTDKKEGAPAVKSYIQGKVKGITATVSLQVTAYEIMQKVGKSITSIGKIYAKKFAAGGLITQPTLALMGEAGKEAVVPLKNNTEWTGVVAELITRQMRAMPAPVYQAGGTTVRQEADLAGLTALLREVRADVAALRQTDRRPQVQINLDGKVIADNTVGHINRQARATGVNPLSAYL